MKEHSSLIQFFGMLVQEVKHYHGDLFIDYEGIHKLQDGHKFIILTRGCGSEKAVKGYKYIDDQLYRIRYEADRCNSIYCCTIGTDNNALCIYRSVDYHKADNVEDAIKWLMED